MYNKTFCASYLHLVLCWLILTAVLCASILLYIKCETVCKKENLKSYNELSMVNKTRIASREEITGTTENAVTVTTATTYSRSTHFPSKLNEDTKNVAKKQGNLNQTKVEPFYCVRALFVISFILNNITFHKK